MLFRSPVNITALDGIDAFLSIVQMPKGVPVATVAIDNSANAALLAIRIIASGDGTLAKRLAKALLGFRSKSIAKVKKADRTLKAKAKKKAKPSKT